MDDVIPAKEMPALFPGTTHQFWNVKRHMGDGPAYYKVGRKVYYRLADVEAWLAANRYTRTDRPAGGDAA